MKTLFYLAIISCLSAGLLAGCASTGQAGSGAPLQTDAPAVETVQPVIKPKLQATEPVQFAAGVLLVYYDAEADGYHVRPVRADTGEALPGRAPIRLSRGESFLPYYAYTADGSTLAAIESQGETCESYAGGSSCRADADILHLIDLSNWEEITATLPGGGWVAPVVFSPDNQRLAVGYHSQELESLLLVDVASGEIAAQHELDFRIEQAAFTRDGGMVMVYGAPEGDEPGMTPPGAPRLRAFSAANLEPVWGRELADLTSGNWCLEGCDDPWGSSVEGSPRMPLFAYWAPAVVFSPHEDRLYILHADTDRLTRVELEDGSLSSMEVGERQSWLERLLSLTARAAYAKGGSRGASKQGVLSLDGRQLYVLAIATDSELNEDGFWETTDIDIELQVIDLESGQIVSRRETQATMLRSYPGTASLLLENWVEDGPETDVLSIEGLEPVSRLEGWELAWAPALDGTMALLGRRFTGESTELALLDMQTYQVVSSWTYEGMADWAVVR